MQKLMLPCLGPPAVTESVEQQQAPQTDAAVPQQQQQHQQPALLQQQQAPQTDAQVPQHQHQQQHQQPTTPVEAYQLGRLTLGFSGGGFLLPYHLGVWQSLAGMGLVSPTTPMAGASAGSLVISGIKAGLSLQQQMDSFMEVAQDCRAHGVNGRLRAVLKAQLAKTLPEDAAERCSDGSCWVSVTQLLPRPANKLYGAFASRRQLIKALLASCHLPRLSDGTLFTSYKALHKRVLDGGFSNLVPVPPVPTAALQSAAATGAATAPGGTTQRQPPPQQQQPGAGLPTPSSSAAATAATAPSAVSNMHEAGADPGAAIGAAPAAALLLQRADSTKGISTSLMLRRPSSSTSSSATSSTTGHTGTDSSAANGTGHHQPSSSHPSGRHQHISSSSSSSGSGSRSVRLGALRRHRAHLEAALAASCEVVGAGAYAAAPGWFAVRVCVLPSRHMHELPQMFRAPAAHELSIALDAHQHWPHDLNATTRLALFPQDDDFLYELFERGAQDAAAWARAQGFLPEVLQRLEQGAADAPHLRVVRRPAEATPTQKAEHGGGQGLSGQQQQQAAAAVAAAADGMQRVQQIRTSQS